MGLGNSLRRMWDSRPNDDRPVPFGRAAPNSTIVRRIKSRCVYSLGQDLGWWWSQGLTLVGVLHRFTNCFERTTPLLALSKRLVDLLTGFPEISASRETIGSLRLVRKAIIVFYSKTRA